MATSDVIVPEEKNSSSVSDIIEKPSLDVLAKSIKIYKQELMNPASF